MIKSQKNQPFQSSSSKALCFEFNMLSNKLLIQQYCVDYQQGEYYCSSSLHGCLLSVPIKENHCSLKGLIPKDFLFQSLCSAYPEQELKNNTLVRQFLISENKKDLPITQEKLLDTLQPYDVFITNIIQFLSNRIIQLPKPLIMLSQVQFATLQKNFKAIYTAIIKQAKTSNNKLVTFV